LCVQDSQHLMRLSHVKRYGVQVQTRGGVTLNAFHLLKISSYSVSM